MQRSTAGQPPVYLPRVIGLADVTYDNARHKVHEQRRVMLIAPVTSDAVSVSWSDAQTVPLDPAELEAEPLPDAHFEEPAAATADPKCYATWTKALQTHLRTSAPLVLLRSSTLKLVSAAGESERAFRIRLQDAAREQRDAAMEKLRAKYAPKLATLDDRIRRAEQAVERERAQARQSGLNTAVSVGGLLSALMGNRKMSRTKLSRMGTAVRSAGRATRDVGDIGRAEENVGALEASRADLESEMQAALHDMEMSFDAQAESLEELELRPKASDVHLHAVGLAWAPHVRSADGTLQPLWRH